MADNIQATPRNYVGGLLTDAYKWMQSPERTQQMQGFAGLLGTTGLPQTIERMAYGEPLTNIGRANVPLLKPETADALMTVAPVAGDVAQLAGKGLLGAGKLAGNAVNEAMVYGRGPLAGITPQPMRAIELGSEFLGKRPPKIENLARTSDKFLFHSSTADKANDLRYGVEPQAGGPWVREIAAGATDQNLDDFFENVTPLAWFSDKPEWIKSMVGRKLNKPFDKVTAKDIEEHGHLAFINKKSPEAENITYIPEQGLMEGGQSRVFDIQGNPKKAWETGLYQEGRYGTQMEPFGVERNEYVSPESVEPLLQLTGPELVQFMKLKGLLEQPAKSAFTYPQEEAMRLAQQRAALPVEQGGLGLLSSNTPAERAKAMGFDIESLHGTSNPNIQKFDPSMVGTKAGNAFDNYMWSTTSPDAATGYSLNMKSYEALPEVVNLKEQKNDILKQISKAFEEKDSEKVGDLRKQLNSIADKESTIFDTFKQGQILSEGSTVYPLALQRQEFMPYDASGKSWMRANKPAIEQSQDLGYQGVQINNVIDNPNAFMGNAPATTFATENPDLLRSRFAAFDPFRRTAATAAAMGVAAPDLLAQEQPVITQQQIDDELANYGLLGR